MHIKSKKLIPTLLAVVLALSLLAAMPLTAYAESANGLKKTIEGFAHGGTGSFNATVSGNTVTVTGSVNRATNQLYLTIDSGVTIVWEASYFGSAAYSGLVALYGDGTFENRGIIVTDGPISAIYASGSNTIKITSGVVRAESTRAIHANGAINTVIVSGGEVSSLGTAAIFAGGSGHSITISGGFVLGKGTSISGGIFEDAAIRMNTGKTPTISGDAVVCAWDKPGGTPTYDEDSSDALIIAPAGATAVWSTTGMENGINYKNGAKSGFFVITDLTIKRWERIKPETPSNLTATAGVGGITLKWKNNMTSESIVYLDRKEGGSFATHKKLPAGTTAYVDEAVEIGKTYTYRLVILADGMWSDYSDEVTVTMVVAPTITGPTTLTLTAGYAATSTGAYTVGGAPAPTVTMTSGNAAITWNDTTKKLDIAAGLAAGSYPVVLKATSGANSATLTFTLTVTATAAVAPPTGSSSGSMANFLQVNTYRAGMFTDVNENQWYGYNQQRAIARAYEYGLMKGNSATTFNPTGNVTVAEAITIAARVHSIYTSGTESFEQGAVWYQVYVDYALAKGIIEAGDFSNYTRAATRAEMAYIFSRSLNASEFTKQNTVNSLPDVKEGFSPATGQPLTPHYNAIITLYEAGVLTGSDAAGTFYPNNNITRAEAAAIISRVILPETRVKGRTY